MLRLPKFEIRRPRELSEAIALLAEAGPTSVVVAGGTDLVPNMKHELFTPEVVVSLEGLPELRGIRREPDGALSIGAMTSLEAVAASDLVRAQAPALAQACSLVAGPQLRSMGTLGGNVMLDTRCQWYNQTYFWRQALGFCLKKDGTACHVVAGGKNCVRRPRTTARRR
jgi:4-hydroxybenzoyl-CoA reductase subunit beta